MDRCGPRWSTSYSKGPEAEDDDDEVHGVGEEHQHVDVGDGAVLGLDQRPEEVEERPVESKAPAHRGGYLPPGGGTGAEPVPAASQPAGLLPTC